MADTSVQDGLIALQERREALALAKAAADEATAKLHEAQSRQKEATDALADLIRHGHTTQDALLDYALVNGIADPLLAHYRAVEVRLRGFQGQLVLVHALRKRDMKPVRRHASDARRAGIMAPPEHQWLPFEYCLCGVLTGEKLILGGGMPELPTGGSHLLGHLHELGGERACEFEYVEGNMPLPTLVGNERPPSALSRRLNGERIVRDDTLCVGQEALAWFGERATPADLAFVRTELKVPAQEGAPGDLTPA